MTILITTIPDDPKAWASWLEQLLVGLRLRDLIEELRLLPETSESALKELLTEQELENIRERGLVSLSVNQIRALLASPNSLLELQEHVLINGDDYWTRLPQSAEMQASTQKIRNRLNSELTDEPESALSVKAKMAKPGRSFLTLLATAAAVLLIGVIAWRLLPTGSGSILGKPGLLANNVQSPAEYLNRIADAGNEWFDQHPRDAPQLISLLKNVSNDCQILIDAPHPILEARLLPDGKTTMQDWFVTKCQNWKKNFDAILAALEAKELSFEDARVEADKTMMKLVNVLRAGPTA